MQVDWFTIIAQIVNFLILVGLLKRFLYGPIIAAMDDREARIAARLQEAKERQEEAAEAKQSFRARRAELEDKRAELMEAARQEAEAARQEMIASAREEVEEMQARWKESLRQEEEAFLEEMRQAAAREVTAATRRILQDLADAKLEASIVKVFAGRLLQMEAEDRERMREALEEAGGAVQVASSFALEGDSRELLEKRLEEVFSGAVQAQFFVSKELICGVEVRAGGRKIAWSVGEYLEVLQETLAGALEEEHKRA